MLILLKYEASLNSTAPVSEGEKAILYLHTGMSVRCTSICTITLKYRAYLLIPSMGYFHPQEGRHSTVPFVTKILRE